VSTLILFLGWLVSIPIFGATGLILVTIFISIFHVTWLLLKF
jgi:hypothetical protein